jgi:EAL domain-containing protein (putative c-di-GMP-specific phosphodiesterase class I)
MGVMAERVSKISAIDLVKGADSTLYWAKEEGRGRYAVFDPDRRARENTRYSLSALMRTALDNGDFVIEYQPIVDLSSLKMVGAEALVRWTHPTLGTLTPDRFIDLAEDNGLIVPLGAYVCESACKQTSIWHDEFPGHKLFISINVSARQIRDPEFPGMIDRVLATTGLPAESLQLELTESASMDTPGPSVAALETVSARGVKIAIDDFGTGFSNLAYLRRLPVDVVKLAGPFIENLGAHERDYAGERIVEALIKLAHSLGQTVTAEQVETPRQVTRLQALLCDTAQGWHFARPLAPDKIRDLLARAPSKQLAD